VKKILLLSCAIAISGVCSQQLLAMEKGGLEKKIMKMLVEEYSNSDYIVSGDPLKTLLKLHPEVSLDAINHLKKADPKYNYAKVLEHAKALAMRNLMKQITKEAYNKIKQYEDKYVYEELLNKSKTDPSFRKSLKEYLITTLQCCYLKFNLNSPKETKNKDYKRFCAKLLYKIVQQKGL